jgi:hypothetical protein
MRAETMRQLWSFVRLKRNREVLAWIGGGLTAVIIGLWTAFVYFSDTPKITASSPNVQASCSSVGIGGNVSGSTVTAGGTGSCLEQKPGPKP